MDGNNILSGGIETLNEIKENLLEVHGYQSNLNGLVSEEESLEKSIKSIEEAITTEIAGTTKKRRQEIEESFDNQIEKVKAKIKKIKDKRDKYKNSKVSERIEEETEFLRVENNMFKAEGKTLLRKNHLPTLCYSKLYYALYSPGDLLDLFIIFGVLLLTLFAIPCGVYFFLLPKQKTYYLIIIYLLAGILFFGLYIIIGNRTKDKHPDIIKEVKVIRKNIKKNNKSIASIRKSILKDRDESTYGLENYDGELQKLQEEVADIEKQKKDAVLTFDNTTSKNIAGDLRGQRESEIEDYKSKLGKCREGITKSEEKVKVLTIKIASEYEPYIGKDLMTLERLESLINIIQAGNANTISDALTFYKQNMENAIK